MGFLLGYFLTIFNSYGATYTFDSSKQDWDEFIESLLPTFHQWDETAFDLLHEGDELVVDGKSYVLGPFLGGGANGRVFELQNYPGQVIKLTHYPSSLQADVAARTSLDQRGVLALLPSYVDPHSYYLLQEKINNYTPIETILETSTDPAQRAAIFEQMLALEDETRAINATRETAFVCDVGLGNTIVDEQGRLKVTDANLSVNKQYPNAGSFWDQHKPAPIDYFLYRYYKQSGKLADFLSIYENGKIKIEEVFKLVLDQDYMKKFSNDEIDKILVEILLTPDPTKFSAPLSPEIVGRHKQAILGYLKKSKGDKSEKLFEYLYTKRLIDFDRETLIDVLVARRGSIINRDVRYYGLTLEELLPRARQIDLDDFLTMNFIGSDEKKAILRAIDEWQQKTGKFYFSGNDNTLHAFLNSPHYREIGVDQYFERWPKLVFTSPSPSCRILSDVIRN